MAIAVAAAVTVLAAVGLAACGGAETLDAPVAEVTPVEGGGGTAAPPDATATTAPLARAAGVVVVEPAVDLGHVPLDVVVRHTFHLLNLGTGPVRLGEVTIAVLEGC